MPPKGRPAASLSALKTMLAAKQAAEAEQKRLDDEAEAAAAAAEAARLERERQEEAERAARKEAERREKEELKKAGKLLSKADKERIERNRLKLEQLGLSLKDDAFAAPATEVEKKKVVYADKRKAKATARKQEAEHRVTEAPEEEVLDDWEAALSDSSSSEDDESSSALRAPASSAVATETHNTTEAVQKPRAPKTEHMRSPICVILGHVDTGKTKLLDRIRQTNVQEGEAGGITQQIGATFFPIDAIREKTQHLPPVPYDVPGLLVIDTPGHESFTNLRSRGSSLCNIAILVVDIMHGLEPQTIESLNLLRQRKTPFIVALNKVDRLYGWKADPLRPVADVIASQASSVQREFDERLERAKLALAEQGLNAEVFYKNDDARRCVSLVPTSAISGDGVADMLQLLLVLTQTMMARELRYISDLQCTVLEVKVIEGLGTTIDVILSNGTLDEGDRIAVAGLGGPIVTSIRALLTPQPMREMRVKSAYVHHKRVRASLGVKISAPDLERAIPGSPLIVIPPGGDEDAAREEVQSDVDSLLQSVDSSGRGVCVQASTLGSLEALLQFLKDSKIPVAAINIGPVHRKDVMRASVMLEQNAKEYAVILAFDVRVDRDAEEYADEMDVRIFRADIIYHLFDQFTAYMNDLLAARRASMAPAAVFPCVLRIIPGCVFNKRSPLIMGVDVAEGVLRVGTPLAVPSQGGITLGRVTSIELNHKAVPEVRRGGPSVAIKVENASYEATRMYGRHFTERDELVSRITRESIDVLKTNFRNDLEKEDWALVVKLKKVFSIA